MNSSFRQKPLLFKIVMAFMLLITAQFCFVFITSLNNSSNVPRTLVQLVLWGALCVGFFLQKKWAWMTIFILFIFSILNIIYGQLAAGLHFSISAFITLAVAGFIIWALISSGVRNLFSIEQRSKITIPSEIAVFALICLSCSLFLVIELLGPNRMAIYTMPGKIFVGFIAFVFVLLGIGLWQGKKAAMQATHSILIFILLVTTFMLLYELYTNHRTLALPNSIFYISASLLMLVFWVKIALPKCRMVSSKMEYVE